MMRPLRHLTAWRLAWLLLVVDGYALFSRGTPWWGEWAWTVDWANGGLIVLGPLLAASTAYDVARLRSSGAYASAAALPRGPHMTLHLSVGSWAVGGAVHVLVVLVALGMNVALRTPGAPPLQAIVPALAMLWACAAIGALVGYLIGSVLAAPVAAVALFAATLLGVAVPVFSVFRPGGSTGSLVGFTWDVWALLLQTLTLVMLGVVALAVIWRQESRVRNRREVTVVAAVAGLAAAALLLIHERGPERFVELEVVPMVCRGDEPRVCLAEATSRSLSSLGDGVTRAVRALESAGVEPRSRYAQMAGGQALPPDTAPLYLETTPNTPTVSRLRVAELMSTPADCPQFRAETPPPESYYAGVQTFTQWLALNTGAAPLESFRTYASYPWLRRPLSEQSSWLRQTYAQMKNCQVARVRPPETQ